MKSLSVRIDEWARTRGWRLVWALDAPESGGRRWVTANVGPVTGRGLTANEALDALADGLVEEGWQDDREHVAAASKMPARNFMARLLHGRREAEARELRNRHQGGGESRARARLYDARRRSGTVERT